MNKLVIVRNKRGKQTMIKKYGNCKDSERSIKKILKRGDGAFGRQFELIHCSAGYEPAGSAMRYTKECYRVVSYDPRMNHRSGQAFTHYSDASEYFYRFTTPITAMEA